MGNSRKFRVSRRFTLIHKSNLKFLTSKRKYEMLPRDIDTAPLHCHLVCDDPSRGLSDYDYDYSDQCDPAKKCDPECTKGEICECRMSAFLMSVEYYWECVTVYNS